MTWRTNPAGERVEMSWVWLDPLGVRHKIYRLRERRASVTVVAYLTQCGLPVTVDDVNALTTVHGAPNCIRCVVALEPPGGP